MNSLEDGGRMLYRKDQKIVSSSDRKGNQESGIRNQESGIKRRSYDPHHFGLHGASLHGQA